MPKKCKNKFYYESYEMYAIDTSQEFTIRDEIPEELRADFDYLENHFMYKDWVVLMITIDF